MSLKDYGYNYNGMKEISLENSLKWFKEKTIYKLYEDDTESACESLEDLVEHFKNGGKFGIEVSKEYEKYTLFCLAFQIIKIFNLENKWLYIDNYYDIVNSLIDDYIINDNVDKSFLDSINDYINQNENKIKEMLVGVFE